MIRLLFIALALVAVVGFYSSCKTAKYTPMDFTKTQITFGTGGGFSGLVNDYTLLENGQLFKRSSQDDKFVELKKAKKKAVKQAINNYTFLGINELAVDQPGNLYYFIEYKDADGKTHRTTWGNGESPHEEKLKLYYSQLASLIKKEENK